MTSSLRITVLVGLLGLGIAESLSASILLTVPGTSNIFAAGQSSTAAVGGGTLPDEVDFIPTPGNVLSFTGPGIPTGTPVTGTTNPCPTCLNAGPDGVNEGSQPPATNISSSGTTLSEIQFTGNEMFLIAVFLGPSLPGSQVASIGDYGNVASGITSTQLTYTPILGQTFFVGDGLTGTGSGSVQQFIVPTGATRLFLGFAEAMSFVGQAGMFSDNTGSLNVNLQIVPSTGVPEPSTIVLVALGFAALAVGRKKISA